MVFLREWASSGQEVHQSLVPSLRDRRSDNQTMGIYVDSIVVGNWLRDIVDQRDFFADLTNAKNRFEDKSIGRRESL